ncbi:MAG: ABC transporter ATP-binding protein [Firmicutes bacterium]|nr:ABC transporter ATP-binding protein [Bacillota bacterium]
MLKLMRYLKPVRFLIILSLLLVMVRALSDLYLPRLTADIVNIGIMNGDTGYILRVSGVMLAIAALGGICAVLNAFFSARASAGFAKILREEVFSHVESFSLNEFDRLGTATLITRTTNDITQLQMFTMMAIRMMVMAPMMSIGGTVMAVSRDPTLSLVFVVALPLLFVVITLVGRKGLPLFREMQEKLDRLNLIFRERLTGVRVIRAFNRDQYERERFQNANTDYTVTAIFVLRIMSVMMPVMMLVMNFTIVAVIWFGGMRVDLGFMMVGDLMAFIQYGTHIMMSMFALSMLFVMVPRAAASAGRINEILEIKPQIVDPPVPQKTNGRRGFVEFRNVTFSYPGAERPAIYNVSFQAGPGETTAIIGGTGSGKSTISNLLLRFYDVESGSILVDGVDIRELPQAELRAKIGYVPQRSVLFSGTVKSNIRFGKEDATDEEIRHAADIAQATEFIEEMPGGFDAVIVQGGMNVSGGQKQRLSIARALVRRPEICIFDDSFSALDFKTDARLRAALKKETAEATVIIVAQRVGTVMDADRIIVLENGRVAGIGTHGELLRNNDIYRETVLSQLSEEGTA